ncbi:MAG TPA: 50S ribosomal protein L24 [Candidatus Acidoferrales bacterium]|nr:50S ribosomal protein L24 [Candidatus Acidoferrales bacterium]
MQTSKPLTKPTKQRKMLYNAPAHVRHRLLAAHLSKALRASHEVRSLPVRRGDTVRVIRGDHRGVEGKITRVDLPKYRVYVEGLTREKVDGTTVFLPVHPSKVIITGLNLDDKWRKKIIERKKERRKRPEEAVEEPEARPVEKQKEVAEAVGAVAAVGEVGAVEEKPAPEEKPSRKRVTRAKRKTTAKKVSKKAKPETGVTEKEEKSRPTRRTRRSPSRSAKKPEEEGQ